MRYEFGLTHVLSTLHGVGEERTDGTLFAT